MAEGRQRHDWGIASVQLAMFANAHRDLKRRPSPFTAEEFNPFAERREEPAERISIKTFVSMIVPASRRKGKPPANEGVSPCSAEQGFESPA